MASDLRITSLEELASAIDSAESAWDLLEISSYVSAMWPKDRYGARRAREMIFDALRAFGAEEDR